MAWFVRGWSVLVLAACSMNNPAYDLREGSSGGSVGPGSGADGGDGVDGADGAVDSGSADGSDGATMPMACSFDARPEFNFPTGPGFKECGAVVEHGCILRRSNGNWELQKCDGLTAGTAAITVEFEPFEPPSWAVDTPVQVRASWSPTGANCHLEWVEIFELDAALPIFAGASVPDPPFESIIATPRPPDDARECACPQTGTDCCPSPIGPYQVSLSSATFGDQFGIDLYEGDSYDSEVGTLGHPYVEVFVAHRAPECGAPLEIDWAMTQK